LTIEQVVGGLNQIASRWLRQRRRHSSRCPAEADAFVVHCLAYHQRRNLAVKRARGFEPQLE